VNSSSVSSAVTKSSEESANFPILADDSASIDDDDVYLDKLQTRGVKKSILSQCET
jgi:hypothetical protein